MTCQQQQLASKQFHVNAQMHTELDSRSACAGSLKLLMPDGAQREVRIERAHMEEDAGKSSHAAGGASTVDYNRAGQ